MFQMCPRNGGVIFPKISGKDAFLVFPMLHERERREAWGVGVRQWKPQGQKVAKNGVDTKEAELRTRERKRFWSQH